MCRRESRSGTPRGTKIVELASSLKLTLLGSPLIPSELTGPSVSLACAVMLSNLYLHKGILLCVTSNASSVPVVSRLLSAAEVPATGHRGPAGPGQSHYFIDFLPLPSSNMADVDFRDLCRSDGSRPVSCAGSRGGERAVRHRRRRRRKVRRAPSSAIFPALRRSSSPRMLTTVFDLPLPRRLAGTSFLFNDAGNRGLLRTYPSYLLIAAPDLPLTSYGSHSISQSTSSTLSSRTWSERGRCWLRRLRPSRLAESQTSSSRRGSCSRVRQSGGTQRG